MTTICIVYIAVKPQTHKYIQTYMHKLGIWSTCGKGCQQIPDIRRKVRGGNTTFLGGMSPRSCPKSGAQSTPNRQDIHPSHDTRETNEHNVIHPFQFTAYPIYDTSLSICLMKVSEAEW